MLKPRAFGMILIILVLLLPNNIYAAMDDSLHIVIETEFLDMDVKPIIENGRALVPIRAIAEKLGFTVEWVSEKQTVIIKAAETIIQLNINEKRSLVNSQEVDLDVPATIIAGRTFVPIRFVSENLGRNVVYDKWMETPIIWITKFNLLKEVDTEINNNLSCNNSDDGPPIYYLKTEGETNRHIKLGDTVLKVKEVYGIPFREKMNNNSGTLVYTTKFLPSSDSGNRIVFKFENNILNEVTIN